MPLPFPTRLVHLDDGRYLCLVECGDPDGVPVFYLHGAPGSRIGGLAFEETARQHGVRLLVPDRPGIGFSDRSPGRNVVQLASDLEQAADALGLDRFGVFGASGGAPYAVAAAYRMPERVTLAVVAMCPGPMADDPRFLAGYPTFARRLIRFGAKRELVMRAVVKLMTRPAKQSGKNAFTAKAAHAMPESDVLVQKWLMANPYLGTDGLEVMRQGTAAPAQDLSCIVGRPWGFRLADVKGLVHIWHGESDGAVPVAGARLMAELIPGSELHVVEGGHYIAMTFRDEIFTSLTSAAG